ncbi:epoxide hydrolase [Luminiphilus sp.]|nr:epoxide hydrolase [Luminiphilus sp.]
MEISLVTTNLPSLEQFTTTIAISDPQLFDLNQRLLNTRLPVAPQSRPWKYGTSLSYLRETIDYWRHEFDWRVCEQELNQFEHIAVPVGQRIVHAVIIRSDRGLRPPIVLAHGWPGSFVEFLEVGEQLAHPERFGGLAKDGASVIIPSLPGCCLSSAPAFPIGPREIAADWILLMRETLNVDKFFIHGSDWGAAVASWLAATSPNLLYGIHLTSAIMQPDLNLELRLSPAEEDFLKHRASRGPSDSGYRIIQGTKPLTLSYALTDSPAGLAAWLLEKYQSWGVSRGTDKSPAIDLHKILTILSLYWFSGPGPSTWIYSSLVDGTGLTFPEGTRVNVPTAICSFKHDISPPSPADWQKRCYKVVRRSAIDEGGHFPGLDAPNALVRDLLNFIDDVMGSSSI